MKCNAICQRFRWPGLSGAILCGVLSLAGCHSLTHGCHSVPASRLDPHFFGEIKEAQVPVLMSALGQEAPVAYRVGPGDTLAIYVFGVLPPTVDETPILERFQTFNQNYYPPHGTIVQPSTGLPIAVGPDGALEMPLLGRVPVAGLTIDEITQKLKKLYTEMAVVQPGRERISVALITKRTHRVVILRQDTPAAPVQLTTPQVVDQIHRGSGQVVDLPAYENDVLHALAYSGGLPGTDAVREIWIMRNCAIAGTMGMTQAKIDETIQRYEHGEQCGPSVIRIPLNVYADCPLPFGPKDVILSDGDVVYVPRRYDYFYTGGLLDAAKIPLPRDEDLDVLQAIALARGSVGGPLAQGGSALANGTPGYFIKPTRALILRKLPDGSQMQIRVDLARAMEDEKERIMIQPEDLVMVHFTPAQMASNAVINFLNFNFNGLFYLGSR